MQGAFGHTYRTEDVDDFFKTPTRILSAGSYHVVVGNPPYITPKDRQEKKNYRAYKSSSGLYALSVPFAERMFQLAIRGAYDGAGAGYVGQITANSFMDREFGKKLIEEYFPNIDLTTIVDTSGAFIPGHGTPTVILIGRRRFARSNSTVRAVLGNRGEPSEPAVPAEGFVWKAIENQVDRPGSESEWVTVADLPRNQFDRHPWSLAGGGAAELMDAITRSGIATIKDRVRLIGRTTHTGSDDVYFAPVGTWHRYGVAADHIVSLVEGDVIRDWTLTPVTQAILPYGASYEADLNDPASARHLWAHRSHLRLRREPGGTHEEIGLTWYEWSRWHPERFAIPLGIAMAFVATHNHFTLDRGGKVFNRSAPVVKLPEGATEDEHLALLGVLNSSTACFWLKQVSHDKGNRGGERSTARYAWENFYEFTGTKLEHFPLPTSLPLERSRELDLLAQELGTVEPSAVCAEGVPTRERLGAARNEYARIRERMIALQEELDWDAYRRYGLLSEAEAMELIADPKFKYVPGLQLGERAFEFLLAERLEGAQGEKQWFERHHSVPVHEIPQNWPREYQDIVRKRIKFIRENRNIGLVERPEYKRRWESKEWSVKEKAALKSWLLDRCEDRSLWFGPDGQPRPITVNRLADLLRTDADMVAVARLYAGDADADLADVLEEIIRDEHVPYLAQLRYKGEGLIKRAVWEQTWDLQREEDIGHKLKIALPPKYTKDDFHKPSYWRNRGKLDVPKERFISYPKASPDSDGSLLLGWAGWDHCEQAHALATLIEERETTDGWDGARIRPLVKGLAEVMPWVRQWHNEVDSNVGQSPADIYDAYLNDKRGKYGLAEWV